MRIEITKGTSEDRIVVTRADGQAVQTRFPKKGPVPHDAVHYFVEKGFGLQEAFWGLVAGGHHPEDIAGMAKAAGHASASRAGMPEAEIVELLQAERLVECFEADLWSPVPGDDIEAFLAVAQTACEYSHVPLPNLTHEQVRQVRKNIALFAQEWKQAAAGDAVRLDW